MLAYPYQAHIGPLPAATVSAISLATKPEPRTVRMIVIVNTVKPPIAERAGAFWFLFAWKH